MQAVMTVLTWIQVHLLWIRGIRYQYNSLPEIPKNQPVIFISNHQSMWDIPPLLIKYRDRYPKFIAKKELRMFIPSVSFYLKNGGAVTIDRSNRLSALKAIRQFALEIKESKDAICIYPEGTRSKDGEVKRFKLSGIAMLLRQAPDSWVVPVAVQNSRLVDAGGIAKKLGVKIEVNVLKPRKINCEKLEKEINAIRDEIVTQLS